MLNRDLVMNVSPALAARAAMTTINALQDHNPGAQATGLCSAFLTFCEAKGIPAQDVLSATKNLMNDREGLTPEFRAVRLYMENEL